MARQINIPSREYTPQVITRTVDSFPANVAKIRASFTRENWPGTLADDVIVVTVQWGDGSGGRWTLPGGQIIDRSGNVATHSWVEIDVPQESDGQGRSRKRNVVNGMITLQILQPLRTAIFAEAV